MKYLLLIVLLFPTFASALELDLWGLSYHTDRTQGFNEQNWGVGLTSTSLLETKWTFVKKVGVFKDSEGNQSFYVGAGFDKEVLPFVRVGGVASLSTRERYGEIVLFPGATPYVSVGEAYKVTLLYLPKVESFGVYQTFAVYFTAPLN